MYVKAPAPVARSSSHSRKSIGGSSGGAWGAEVRAERSQGQARLDLVQVGKVVGIEDRDPTHDDDELTLVVMTPSRPVVGSWPWKSGPTIAKAPARLPVVIVLKGNVSVDVSPS